MENNNLPQAQRPAMSPLKAFNATLTNARTQDYLQQVLGAKKASFVNNITALVANSTALQACEPMSLIYACIKATALDLPLDQNLGMAHVIPYKNGKTGKQEAQLQLGYRAFIQLAIRSGQFQTINVSDVREGEIVDEDIISGEIKIRRAPNRLELPIVGYVSFFSLTNGFRKMLYMTVDEMEAHGKRYSQTYASSKDYIRNSSKWSTDFDAMAKKTAIKLLLSKYAPLSVEMRDAVRVDQAVINESGDVERYPDNADDVQYQEDAHEEARNKASEVKEAIMRAQAGAGMFPDEQ